VNAGSSLLVILLPAPLAAAERLGIPLGAG
jgi:hypothetical protein